MNFIPLWLIGGLFFYILSSIEFREPADQADTAAQSATNISNFDSRMPRQNALSLLKQQLYTAKHYQISSKFNHFDDHKTLLPIAFLPFLIAYHGQTIVNNSHDNGLIKPTIFVLQRAPPSLNSSLQYA